jgi:hypothetical protein
VAGHLRIATMPFSHRHLPQLCLQPDLVPTSPVERLAFYFPVLALFPVVFCFCLFSLFFGFGFSLYCSFSVCFVCVLFLQFCRSPPHPVCRPPPTAKLYFALPRDELQTHLSVVGVCLNAIGFSLHFLFACIDFFHVFYVVFLLVIMLSPRWFGWIPFSPDLRVMDVYVTLVFGSRRKISPDFCVVDECVS